MTVERQLRQALTDSAAAVPAPPDRWDEVERRAGAARIAQRRDRNRWRTGGVAVVGLAAAVTLAAVLPGLRHDSTQVRIRPLGPGSTVGGGAAPTVGAGSGAVPTHTSAPTATTKPTGGFSYQPLWPFRSLAEANAWLTSYQAGGHQPWHGDPAQTALAFSSGYLGYQNINTTYGTRLDDTGAHVTVGFDNPNGQPVKAAIVHLRKFGITPEAPWEVVGTDDTDFSLMSPKYGVTVISPLRVGGSITGVDESIKVQVLQPSSTARLGQTPGLAAGGVASSWSTSVTFRGATDGVITVAASTGGHVAPVERFTVTAVRTTAGPATSGL
jgi:hypothetical protein